MLYINQRDYPNTPYPTRTDKPDDEYGRNTTVASSACGPCAAMMVVDRLCINVQFSLEDALQLAYDSGANHRTGTDYRKYGLAVAEKFHLEYRTTGSVDELRECLRTGGCAVALCGKRDDEPSFTPVFTYKGHYVTVISEERDGRFCVLDPNYYEGKFEEADRGGKVEVKGAFCLVSPEVLQEDTKVAEERAFHLFRRQ